MINVVYALKILIKKEKNIDSAGKNANLNKCNTEGKT